MGEPKKLVFITTRLFWPINSGRKVSLYYYCKGLHEQYGYEISLYSFTEAGQGEQDLTKKPKFIQQIKLAAPISKGTKIKNLLLKSLGSQQWPFQNSLYYSEENVTAIKEFCEKIQPHVVITDMIRTAPYLKAFEGLPCKKILDMDDLLSKRYIRQMKSKFSEAGVAGQYGKQMSGLSNRLLSVKELKNFVLSMESKRLKKAEIEYARQYDSVIFVSEMETEELNRQLGERKAYTVTMGVDYDYFSAPVEVTKQPGTLSFVGNMHVAANVDTLQMIANDILPKIKHQVVLKVIGACPERLKKEYQGRADIEFCGQVEDLRKYVKSTEIFLAPIAYGSGIKTKILEAMAMGMPVVTNSVGAEGIAAENGVHYLVHDAFAKLTSSVGVLLQDDQLQSCLGAQAQKLMQEKYTWQAVWKSIETLGL